MSRPLPDADARREALDLDLHALVTAPAGSGKTGLLVQRMLRALASAENPEQVVAITFTNKAAAEIRNRILELLRAAAAGHAPKDDFEAQGLAFAQALLARDAQLEWHLLEQPERLRALTIDSFCAQIAAQLPLLSGLGGAVRVADDPWPLYVEAITRLFDELEDSALPEPEREALEVVLRLAGNRLDRLLQPLAELLSRREQWLPLLLRAGQAGWEQAEQAALQALVTEGLARFDAAFDPGMQLELVELLCEGADCEPLGWAAGLARWPEAEAAQLPLYRRLAGLLITQGGRLRSPKGINVRFGFPPKHAHTQRMKDLLAAVEGDEALCEACVTVSLLPDATMPEDLRRLRSALLRTLLRLAGHLRVVFGQSGQTDFPQIAQSALAALRPAAGEAGDALLAADARIRHLLVDEMQDTSEGQLELLRQLTQDWQAGDGRSLFLVGDPQQSIYAFRKAEVRLFLELWDSRRLGTLALTPLQLNANFRSDAAVVGWFNAAFTRIFPARADTERGIVPFAPSVALREAQPGSGIRIAAFAEQDDSGAAAQAAADAEALQAQGGSVVVLARARSHLEPVIRALRARGLTPACQDIDPLAALPEVRDYLALAYALWHPSDRLHWAALLRTPFVGLGWEDLVLLSRGIARTPWPQRIAQRAGLLSADGQARISRLQAALQATALTSSLRASLAERAETVWHALGGPGCVSRDALDDVHEAMRLLRRHAAGGGLRDLESLERGLQQLYAAPRAGQVQLMTVHKAKGLEFDHVLLVGTNRRPRGEDKPLLHLRNLQQGELLVPRPPDSWPEDHPAHRLFDHLHRLHRDSRAQEGLRLLYVAITRAKKTATLYVCADRNEEGQPRLASGSFAGLLALVIAADLARQSTPAISAAADTAAVPLAPRLPLDYRYTAEDDLYRPQEARTLKPSEAVLSAQQEPQQRRADDGDLYAQLVGTLYHETLEKVAADGLDAWADGGESRRRSLAAGLRRRGLPEPQVEPAVSRVLELLRRTLAGSNGRWLLQPRRWARSEYALAGWREGRWISAVIDRCFEDDDGTLWVIDYKAAAWPIPAEALEAQIAERVERYRGQLGEYAALLRELRPDQALRTALYFPEADRLVTL